jgi:hypothetical protein
MEDRSTLAYSFRGSILWLAWLHDFGHEVRKTIMEEEAAHLMAGRKQRKEDRGAAYARSRTKGQPPTSNLFPPMWPYLLPSTTSQKSIM